MNLHVNVFDESVKHVSAQGVPTAVKRVDARRVLIIVDDKIAVINANEIINTIVEVMDKGDWK